MKHFPLGCNGFPVTEKSEHKGMKVVKAEGTKARQIA